MQAAALDWNFVKRYRDGNYKLWVPEFLPDSNPQRDGHDVWVEMPDEVTRVLRVYYCLHSAMDLDADSVSLVTLDPALSERATLSAPAAQPEGHGIEDQDQDEAFDGLECYRLATADPDGTWRVVFTARDAAGRVSKHWRTHDSVPMIAVNATVDYYAIRYISGTYAGVEWHGAWCRPAAMAKTLRLNPPARVLPRITDDQYFLDEDGFPLRDITIRTGVNGGFFMPDGSLIGYVGTGSAWPGNSVDAQRWGFGFTSERPASATIERDVPVQGQPDIFMRADGVHNYPYGLSSVGCLLRGGQTPAGGSNSYPDPGTKDARTLVAWTTGGSFFLVTCDGNDEVARGWNWQDMVAFLTDGQTGLPRQLRDQSEEVKHNVVFTGGMGLDGGGSTCFGYRIHTLDHPGSNLTKEKIAPGGPRNVPSMVLGWHDYSRQW